MMSLGMKMCDLIILNMLCTCTLHCIDVIIATPGAFVMAQGNDVDEL